MSWKGAYLAPFFFCGTLLLEASQQAHANRPWLPDRCPR